MCKTITNIQTEIQTATDTANEALSLAETNNSVIDLLTSKFDSEIASKLHHLQMMSNFRYLRIGNVRVTSSEMEVALDANTWSFAASMYPEMIKNLVRIK